MDKNISISICVPALNEEKSLSGAVEDLILSLSPYIKKLEVIVVNDGSTDTTEQIAEQLVKEYSQVKVAHHKKKLGVGSCFRDALVFATGDYFTWFPADHENSAEEFIQCVPYLSPNTIVTCHHWGRDHRPVLRRLISRIYTWILNKYFGLDLKYYNGLTIFPTSILRSFTLITNGFFFLAESLIRAIKSGCRIVELSVPLRKRDWGKPKIFTFLSLTQMVRDFIHILLSRR